VKAEQHARAAARAARDARSSARDKKPAGLLLLPALPSAPMFSGLCRPVPFVCLHAREHTRSFGKQARIKTAHPVLRKRAQGVFREGHRRLTDRKSTKKELAPTSGRTPIAHTRRAAARRGADNPRLRCRWQARPCLPSPNTPPAMWHRAEKETNQ